MTYTLLVSDCKKNKNDNHNNLKTLNTFIVMADDEILNSYLLNSSIPI